MILNMDIKGLEVVAVCYLSKDKVLKDELDRKIDIHTMNESVLGLPTRKVAKTFKFRTVYGGMYFHNDPDFAEVSTSKKFWDKVIEKYYEKYSGIYKWHQNIIRTVCDTGMLVSPTGRSFKFEWKENWKGEKELPITKIKNYPVSKLAA